MFFGLVTKHACDRQTDGRTDGQTDRITTPKTSRRAVKMDEENADVVIAATCLMLSCLAQVAITAMRKEHKSRRSTWVCSYLRKRNA